MSDPAEVFFSLPTITALSLPGSINGYQWGWLMLPCNQIDMHVTQHQPPCVLCWGCCPCMSVSVMDMWLKGLCKGATHFLQTWYMWYICDGEINLSSTGLTLTCHMIEWSLGGWTRLALTWYPCDRITNALLSSMSLSLSLSAQACQPNHVSCRTGRCIPLALRCDRDDDCGDMSDETSSCGESDWICILWPWNLNLPPLTSMHDLYDC